VVAEYSRASSVKRRLVTVSTTDGSMVVWDDPPTPEVHIKRPGHVVGTYAEVPRWEPLRTMVDAFAQSIKTGRPSQSSGRRALPLIEAIERAVEEVDP
jgi:predicted dehydrogenase